MLSSPRASKAILTGVSQEPTAPISSTSSQRTPVFAILTSKAYVRIHWPNIEYPLVPSVKIKKNLQNSIEVTPKI